MVQKFTLRFPSCAARKSFSIDEPLTQSTFEIPEYAALRYKVASGIPFSEINHVGGDQLKFKISAPVELTNKAIFNYGASNLDFSGSKRLPKTDRRSLYHTETGIAYGIRQHNVLLGNGCRGTVGDFLVCGGVGNDIKWILHPRNLQSDFHFQSHFMFNQSLGETGISFELWNGVAKLE